MDLDPRPTPAGDWYEDPTGRFEHRYWEGDRWTELVASAGVQITDPLGGAALPAPVPVTADAPARNEALGAPGAEPTPDVPPAPGEGTAPMVSGSTPAAPSAPAVPVRGASTRQRFGWFMTGLGGLVASCAFLPWAEGRGGATLGGFEWGPGRVTLAAGILLALYGAQGISADRSRVRFHGWATAVIVIGVIVAAGAQTVVEEIDDITLGIGQIEPGIGVSLTFLALLVAIWPLVMLWRDDKRRRRSAGSPA